MDPLQEDARIEDAAAYLRGAVPPAFPKIAILLGSGLGEATSIASSVHAEIPYTDIPGFPVPSVSGHSGKATFATVGDVPVLFLKGRVHGYEGPQAFPALKIMIRALKAAGIDTLFLTNAAGSLREDVRPGNLMLISDHINFAGMNPLIGPNNDRWGPRFPGVDRLWNPELRTLARKAARDADLDLPEGVYIFFAGPSFETHAEIRMAKGFGADCVAMSTVPEALLAHHCGLRVVGCSAITNMGAGLSDALLDGDHVLEVGGRCAGTLGRLLERFLPLWKEDLDAADSRASLSEL